jgi:flagellar assembly protein FliH
MSTIIKAATGSQSHSGAQRQPVAFPFEDMAGQAKWYLDSVRKQAERILQDAHEEARAIRAKAEAAGQHAGMAAVKQVLEQQVASEMASLAPALKKSVDAIEQSRQEWKAHWRRSATHLAAAMAERLIRRELKAEPNITLDLVGEALELAAGSSEITLYLHPDDHQRLGAATDKIVGQLARLGPAQVVADPDISLGGCRVETRHGVIDQSFEAQLARIEEELA